MTGRPLPLAELTLVVDTREQDPYDFTGLCPVVRQALPAGDYSIAGYQRRFACERKSLADAYATFGRGRERFTRELERLATYDYAAIVLEFGLDDPPPPLSRVRPATVLHSLLAWSVRYRVVPLWCGSRDGGRAVVLRLAWSWWRAQREARRSEARGAAATNAGGRS